MSAADRARAALERLMRLVTEAGLRLAAAPHDPDELEDLAVHAEAAADELACALAPDLGFADLRVPCPRCRGWAGRPAYGPGEGRCRRCGGAAAVGLDALSAEERAALPAPAAGSAS